MSSDRRTSTDIRCATAPDGTHTITVSGEVDIFNAETFEDALRQAPEAGSVLVDLRECRYIDSAAVAALIRFRKKATGKVRIVVNGIGAVHRVLALTKIDEIIDIEAVPGN